MLSLRDPGEFAQRCKIYLNKVWYRLRVLGCQWYIPTKKSPPPPSPAFYKIATNTFNFISGP